MRLVLGVGLGVVGFFLTVLAFLVSLGPTLNLVYFGGSTTGLWIEILKFLLPAIFCASSGAWLVFKYK